MCSLLWDIRATPLQICNFDANAGRVKRCSSKQVDIVSLGALRLDPGWHNAGYIFPDGFTTSTVFRSSVRHPRSA